MGVTPAMAMWCKGIFGKPWANHDLTSCGLFRVVPGECVGTVNVKGLLSFKLIGKPITSYFVETPASRPDTGTYTNGTIDLCGRELNGHAWGPSCVGVRAGMGKRSQPVLQRTMESTRARCTIVFGKTQTGAVPTRLIGEHRRNDDNSKKGSRK